MIWVCVRACSLHTQTQSSNANGEQKAISLSLELINTQTHQLIAA